MLRRGLDEDLSPRFNNSAKDTTKMAIMATPKCNEGPKHCVPSPYRWCYGIFVLELIASRHIEVFVGSCALLHVDQAHIVAQAQREVLVEVNARTQA